MDEKWKDLSMEEILKNISWNISACRAMSLMSQEQLAKEIGVAQSSIGTYERGIRVPGIDIILNISRRFEIPLETLISEKIPCDNPDFEFVGSVKNRSLYKYILERNLSMAEISRKTGLSRTTIYSILHGDNFTIKSMMKLCDALNCKLSDVMSLQDYESEEDRK